jgi:putative transport protein
VTPIYDLDANVSIGLLTGALTSTPGLAVAIDTTSSPLASIGYGIAYPFGVIGVILFVRILPHILKVKVADIEKKLEQEKRKEYPDIINRNFEIENEKIIGKSIGEINLRSMTNAVVSRVFHKGVAITPTKDTVLQKGDLIKAVGTVDALNKMELIVGKTTEAHIPLSSNYDVQAVLVTNKAVENLTIRQLNLFKNYNASITRIRRSGIDIVPEAGTHVHLGDKLTIACSKEDMEHVIYLLGNEDKKLSDTDFFPIAFGIVLGILLGRFRVEVGENFAFSPGLTGGVLIAALLLGRLGRTGPIIWTMSGAANQLLRQLGLLFFLAAVGTNAGAKLVDTYQIYGIKLFVIGAVITLVPMLVTTIMAHKFYKINILAMLGMLTGSMTSTPGLAAVDTMTDNNLPQVAYAAVYPVAMVFLILLVQVLSAVL